MSNAVQGDILQIIETKYSTALPCTLLAFYYIMLICTMVIKKNRKFYGGKEHAKALVFGIIDSISNIVCTIAF